jgi:hypothetical protein
MPDANDAFAHATDNLIALYRSIERNTLDLPLVSVMPALIFFWSVLKFYFFLIVGTVLIIPTNLVILIRNFFPGHWRYRPFFLSHFYYVCLWIWRGEALTAPVIFIRPLFNTFMKGHFQRRLRRLRLEILLRDGLSDATRSALLARLDAALERWKTPRFAAVFFTVVVPGIISFPSWYKQLIEFLGSFEIHMPTGAVVNVVSNVSSGSLALLSLTGLGYLVGIPITCFLAKRGLFIGRTPDRICFPGGQGGSGAYLKEQEILGGVGLHAREAPTDLWLFVAVIVISGLLMLLSYDAVIAWMRDNYVWSMKIILDLDQELERRLASQYESELRSVFPLQMTVSYLFLLGSAFIALLRRRRTGRI